VVFVGILDFDHDRASYAREVGLERTDKLSERVDSSRGCTDGDCV
jgi:hypothetical protein